LRNGGERHQASRCLTRQQALSTSERNPNRTPSVFRNAVRMGGRGIALWTQHTHQALGGNLRAPFEVPKSGRGVDIVAENGLAGRKVSVNDALDSLAQKRMAGLRVALCPRPNGFVLLLKRDGTRRRSEPTNSAACRISACAIPAGRADGGP
jgi:hypothetical protein